jgi:hypothetical protein
MIFGFGTAAYGPGRTELVLAEDDAGSTIRRAVEVLRRGGPAQAHRFLTTPPGRLRHCRASWASRFLYFAGFRSCIQRRQPLVFDARVAARLARYGIDLDVHAPDDYEVYLRLAASWCTHLGMGRADRVELALAAR